MNIHAPLVSLLKKICINLCWMYVYNLSIREIINILARIQYACVERLDIGVGDGGPGGMTATPSYFLIVPIYHAFTLHISITNVINFS